MSSNKSKANGSKSKQVSGKSKAKKAPAKANVKPAKPAKTVKAVTTVKAVKTTKPGKYPHHEKNPFRPTSSYAQVFDAFATFKDGIRRDELLKVAADATGKDAKHAAYDLAVILSAKDSNTGPRHQSCRDGFWVKRENSHLTMMID